MSKYIFDYLTKVSSNDIAIIYKNEFVSYYKLKEISESLATCLEKHSCKDKPVIGILIEEKPELVYSFLAAAKLNAICFFINPKYPTSIVQEVVSKIKPQFVITEPKLVYKLNNSSEKIKEHIIFSSTIWVLKLNFVERKIDKTDDVFTILFTSGTTSFPKGVFHKQQDFIFVGEKCFFVWKIFEQKKFLSFIPLCSAATLGCVLVPCILNKSTLIIPENRKPYSLVKTLNEHEIDFVIGTPTSYIEIVNYLEQTQQKVYNKKICGTVAGAYIPNGFTKFVKEKIGLELYPHYGMTETLAVTSCSDETIDFDTVGKPLPGVEIKISKDNEIVVKSPAVTSGYLYEGNLPIIDGWFYTKDLGIIDKNGNLKVFGRKDEMINRGGNNVYPSEIEEQILKLSSISDCAAVGIPDKVYGEKIVAFVVPKDTSSVKEEDIKSFLKDFLPVFKIPDEVVFVSQLPKTENGKVIRKELKVIYQKLKNSSDDHKKFSHNPV